MQTPTGETAHSCFPQPFAPRHPALPGAALQVANMCPLRVHHHWVTAWVQTDTRSISRAHPSAGYREDVGTMELCTWHEAAGSSTSLGSFSRKQGLSPVLHPDPETCDSTGFQVPSVVQRHTFPVPSPDPRACGCPFPHSLVPMFSLSFPVSSV